MMNGSNPRRHLAELPRPFGPGPAPDLRRLGGGDIRGHHQWWLKRLPKVPGRMGGVANQWWRYIINPNDPEF